MATIPSRQTARPTPTTDSGLVERCRFDRPMKEQSSGAKRSGVRAALPGLAQCGSAPCQMIRFGTEASSL